MLLKLKLLWNKIPVLFQAVVLGLLISFVGIFITSLPLIANINFYPSIPWAFPATCLLLWFFWKYASGTSIPESTKMYRQKSSRVDSKQSYFSINVIFLCLVVIITIVSMRLLMPSFVSMSPPELHLDISSFPILTAWGLLLSVSLSAGVVEEVAFRGYMQRPLEEKYGIIPAVLIVGLIFWVVHLNHTSSTIIHLTFYVFVSVITGLIAFYIKSLIPVILIHTISDAIILPVVAFQWPKPIWQLLSSKPIWQNEDSVGFFYVLSLFTLGLIATIYCLFKISKIKRVN